MCVSQENIWLDSVSLLIKDTFDGEMLLIDKLSGSVFHHYSSPSSCKDCKSHPEEVRPCHSPSLTALAYRRHVTTHHTQPPFPCNPQQIHMAELERASLRSERISDRPSSPPRPDDQVLDEQNLYQVSVQRVSSFTEPTEHGVENRPKSVGRDISVVQNPTVTVITE